MNEDRLAEQIGRAQRASELLNDGLLAEAIKASKVKFLRACWRPTTTPNCAAGAIW